MENIFEMFKKKNISIHTSLIFKTFQPKSIIPASLLKHFKIVFWMIALSKMFNVTENILQFVHVNKV
jgi:hypothetical protein